MDRPLVYADRRQCVILLAVECPSARLDLSILLTRKGAAVSTVSTGQECFDFALARWGQKRPFDVIIADTALRDYDAVSLMLELRQRGYEAPVIGISSPLDLRGPALLHALDAYIDVASEGYDRVLLAVQACMRANSDLAAQYC